MTQQNRSCRPCQQLQDWVGFATSLDSAETRKYTGQAIKCTDHVLGQKAPLGTKACIFSSCASK